MLLGVVSDGPFSLSTPCVSWHWFLIQKLGFVHMFHPKLIGCDNKLLLWWVALQKLHNLEKIPIIILREVDQCGIISSFSCKFECLNMTGPKTFSLAWSFTFGLQLRDISSQGQKQDLGKNVYSYKFFHWLTGLKVMKSLPEYEFLWACV